MPQLRFRNTYTWTAEQAADGKARTEVRAPFSIRAPLHTLRR
jgi:hypothetical protein